MIDLDSTAYGGLIGVFSELSCDLNFLFIDTAAGISESVVRFASASQEVIMVVCDEPTSITDAYALIKLLSRDYRVERFRILTNRVTSTNCGYNLFQKLVKVTDRFLDVYLDFLGIVPDDEYLRKAVQRQRAVVEAYPNSKAAIAFDRLAARIQSWPAPLGASGKLEFFVERLIYSEHRRRLVCNEGLQRSFPFDPCERRGGGSHSVHRKASQVMNAVSAVEQHRDAMCVTKK
jgi:ATPases involved in chromosome partitioning